MYVCSFVCSFVRSSVTLMKIMSQFCVKVSQMGISQQSLIRNHSHLGRGTVPWRVCLHSMYFGPRVHAPGGGGGGWRSKSRTP